MSLSRKTGVANFCFDLGTSYFAIFCILLQSKSHQNNFHTFFPRLPWTTFFASLPFFISMASRICALLSRRMTGLYYHKRLCSKVSSILASAPTLSLRASLDALSRDHSLVSSQNFPKN